MFELSEDPEFPLLEDPFDALESPEEEEEFEEPLEEESLEPELPLDAVLFPESEEEPELELEFESEDPELLLPPLEDPLLLLAVSEGDPDVLEESEVFELEEVWSEEPDDPLLELPLPELELDGVVVEPPLLFVLSAGGVTGFPEPSPGTNTTPGLPLFPGTPPVAVCWLPRKKNGNKRPFFLWPQL